MSVTSWFAWLQCAVEFAYIQILLHSLVKKSDILITFKLNCGRADLDVLAIFPSCQTYDRGLFKPLQDRNRHILRSCNTNLCYTSDSIVVNTGLHYLVLGF